MPEAQLDGERVKLSRPIQNGSEDHSFLFWAEDIRMSATGVHAKITLGLDGTILAWDTFNVERDKDRTHIANRAHSLLSGLQGAFPKDHLKHELDIFCSQLWGVYQGHYDVQVVDGKMNEGSIEFYLKPYLPKYTGSITFGPPGKGKSYLMMIQMVCMDSGASEWWDVGTPTKVLFVNLERSPQSIQHRLARVNLCLGYPETRSLHILNARGHNLVDVKESVKRAVGELGIEVVGVDSISRAGMGDLTSNDRVNAICDTLNNIAPTWMAIGHSPRGDDTHLFGGVHFDAAADVMVRLTSERQSNTLGISLEITKGNDLPDFPAEYIALDFDGEIGLVGIRHPDKMEFSELVLAKKVPLLTQIVEYLQDVNKASATQIADAIGGNRGNIGTLLRERPEFTRIGRDGIDVLYGIRQFD